MKRIKFNFYLCFLLGTLNSLGIGAKLKLTPLAGGFSNPVYATWAPGESERIYVVEQAGRIRVVEKGAVKKVPFLDIRNKVRSGGERGLLSVAFHPDFNKKKSKHQGRYFVNYTSGSPLATIIAEYKKGKKTDRELMRFAQPFSNHNGGQIEFGPDGYLYIGTGDGGSANDPRGYGQNLKTLLGKMLRIDINGGGKYRIPKDNPFIKKTDGTKKEIYAYGLRNPWRFSFDRKSGELFTGDVGQYRWEEIDIIKRGGNYGWKTMEGTRCFSPSRNCNTRGLELPIHEYGRGEGISVTGGYVYRGKAIASLQGTYVFGDYGSGKIWGLKKNSKGKWKSKLLLASGLPISSFGEDFHGEILVVSHSGTVFRLTAKN